MNKYQHTYQRLFSTAALCISLGVTAIAGNPDRQGEAGAPELTINPWARGTIFVNCARSLGVEATYLNPAAVGRMGSEIVIARTNYLQGSGLGINAAGAAIKFNDKSAIGISLMSMDFGEIEATSSTMPEGTGAKYQPSFVNIGLSYAYTFEKRLSVGLTARSISESTSNLSASSIALDAGVLYTTGEKKEIHFGVSLKNIGAPMIFTGDGMSFVGLSPQGTYSQTLYKGARVFELPSSLNIGAAYDWHLADRHILTLGANFTSNSFARDQIVAGFDYSFKKMFMFRASYTLEPDAEAPDSNGNVDLINKPLHTGLGAGVSLNIPFKKETNSGLGIDYGFRATSRFAGSHTIGLRLSF
jgi:hypothetical protein